MIFLQNHMIPEDNNTFFVKNDLWMPFWTAVKFLTQAPLRCPRSFWKLLISVPMSKHPSPGLRQQQFCGEKGTWTPHRNVPLGFPQDPRELLWEHSRVILLCDPFTDPVSLAKTFFTLMSSTPHTRAFSVFILRFVCSFLSGLQQDKFYGCTLHNLLVPWTYSDK